VALRNAALPWLLALGLPIVVMLPCFSTGLTESTGTFRGDGWWYIACGNHVWHSGLGAQPDESVLRACGSRFKDCRYISFAMLGYLSPLVHCGDTHAVSGLFRAWGLFVVTCAVYSFWIAAGQRLRIAIPATIGAVLSGWVTNMICINNFDQLLSLAYMPAIAATFWLWPMQSRRRWLLSGCFIAGAVYTYPECAVFVLAGSILIGLPETWSTRAAWRLWLRRTGAAIGLAILLLLPATSILSKFVWSQFQKTGRLQRPGEGIFPGLNDPRLQPSAFWGLGSEYGQSRNSVRDLNAAGSALIVVGLIGLAILVRKRQWGMTACVMVLVGLALYFIVAERYPYAAYKFIAFSWWCLIGAVIIGADWLLGRVRPAALAPAAASLFLAYPSFYMVNNHLPQFRVPSLNSELPASAFQSVGAIGPMIVRRPLVVAFDDWLAEQMAIYYLRETPLRLVTHPPRLEAIASLLQIAPADGPYYVLTDWAADTYAPLSGKGVVWSCRPYRLFKVADGAIILGVWNSERRSIAGWQKKLRVDESDTCVSLLAGQDGTVRLTAAFSDVGAVDQARHRLEIRGRSGQWLEVTTKRGAWEATWEADVQVRSGKNEIGLRLVRAEKDFEPPKDDLPAEAQLVCLQADFLHFPNTCADGSVATAIEASDRAGVASSVCKNRSFVQRLYKGLLGRHATPAELDSWVRWLATNGRPAAAKEILYSDEALGRIVESFYRHYLGRNCRAQERESWVFFLRHGGNLEQMTTSLVISSEYLDRIEASYVQSLYINILGRIGSDEELARWNEKLKLLGRDAVANAFSRSVEYRVNSVVSFYKFFRHRTPNPNELAAAVGTQGDLLSLEAYVLDSPE
jgi:hypothetical protein